MGEGEMWHNWIGIILLLTGVVCLFLAIRRERQDATSYGLYIYWGAVFGLSLITVGAIYLTHGIGGWVERVSKITIYICFLFGLISIGAVMGRLRQCGSELTTVEPTDVVLVDRDGYPTKIALTKLRKMTDGVEWDLERVKNLVEYLREIWWQPDWGIEFETKKNKWKLWLHTGGWSGNEEIMQVLRESIFWMLYWRIWKRGGHFYFSNSDWEEEDE